MDFLLSLLVVGVGLFVLAAVIFDWDFFMLHPKAKFFVSMFGRHETRLFYGGMGLFVLAVGVVLILQIAKNTS